MRQVIIVFSLVQGNVTEKLHFVMCKIQPSIKPELKLVPGAGIEPARIAARDFESRASTNSATRAFGKIHYCIIATQPL